MLAAGACESAACHGSETAKGSGLDGAGGWGTPAGPEVANHVVAATGGEDDAAVVPLSGPAKPAQGGRWLLEPPDCWPDDA